MFTGFFEAVFGEVEDGDAAAGLEDAGGFADGAVGMQRVVERLREEDDVNGGVVDGEFFHVAEAVVDVLDAVACGLLAGELDHLCGGVDGDDLLGALGKEEREAAVAGAEVGDDHAAA